MLLTKICSIVTKICSIVTYEPNSGCKSLKKTKKRFKMWDCIRCSLYLLPLCGWPGSGAVRALDTK